MPRLRQEQLLEESRKVKLRMEWMLLVHMRHKKRSTSLYLRIRLGNAREKAITRKRYYILRKCCENQD